jgi:alanyl-tRNA synthetase
MFYDITEEGLGDLTRAEYDKADDEGRVVEIWNDVFMEYEKKDGKIVAKLAKKNVDTGAGLERISAILQKKDNVFDTDGFAPIMAAAETLAGDLRRQRIVSDHIRTAVFMIADGVTPSNTDQGYVLRRIIRRMVFNTNSKSFHSAEVSNLVGAVVSSHGDFYQNLKSQEEFIISEIVREADKFAKTIEHGLKEFDKTYQVILSGYDGYEQKDIPENPKVIPGFVAFNLFTSHGFPIELTLEIAKEKGLEVDLSGFHKKMKEHQALSRAGAEQKFKGGLGDTSEMSVKYHTATHLLHKALRDVLGPEVGQKGSNITPERLRFDFSFSRKMTDEEKKKVEDIVNAKIAERLPVHKVILPKAEAEKTGAFHFFGDKYGDQVSVYYIGDSMEGAYSKEFCGGPHVENISTLGRFKIQKEEAVSAGVRRIKAVLS